ncbi:hypothetical protein FSY59_01930 [Comamonas sp. Z3]|nr:hypothetical protein FSY59_01930 [Comamonas sp. Z3]
MLHHWVVVSLLRTMGTTVTATEAATTAIVGDAMSMSRTTGTSDPIARTDARMTAGARSTDPEVCAAA